MQTVSRIVIRRQLRMIAWIPKPPIKINHRIEPPTRLDPLIDSVPRLLSNWQCIWLQCHVGTAEWRDGCPEHWDAEGMYSRDNLFVRLDKPVPGDGLVFYRRGCGADVVDAFEYHGVLHPGLSEYVSVDTAHSVRTKAIIQNPIATGSLVYHTNRSQRFRCRLLELIEK